ncbi:hypothetical protein GP486_003123 [Trichoglossum hirsutum]|uniref:Uncharacterized protein n=1 Tax=Trichoglossum hirsutum TaxID=265104 RepID=A0A9P8RRH4_9PEZI|nr:hypothetical protein GP486_003123 [Trichoglossum hirsutum]
MHSTDGPLQTMQLSTLIRKPNVWPVETRAPNGTPPLLKRFCYSLVYFEHAFEVLFPPERRGNEYAKSNTYDNPQFLGKPSSEIFAMIGACSNNTGLVNLMNNGNHRYFTWNFTNLLKGGKGTVEFRRGPGVTAAKDCLSWMELAVYFVQAACRLDSPSALGDYPATVEGLWSFISKGLESETDKPLQIGLIFAGKSGSAVPSPVGPLSAEKQQKLAQKMNRDDKKQVTAQKFLRLL